MSFLQTIFSFYRYGLEALLFVAVCYLVVILLDEDRSALWRGRFYKVIHALTHAKEAEKKFISNDVNGRINLARRKLHFGEEVLPKSVSVEWVADSSSQTYDLKEGEFAVRLDPANCQEKNVVHLATAVVQRTSCSGVRHIMEKPLIDAVDLNLVRNILAQIGNRKILDWFFTNEYKPRVGGDSDLTKWNNQIVELDEKGLFTRILLVELDAFARRICGMTPKLYMAGEIEGLISFLYGIATKQYGRDVPLEYRRAFIRVGVIIVARTSKLLTEGIQPYVQCMNFNVQRQLEAVYVLTFDKEMLGAVDRKAYEEFRSLTKSLDKSILQSSKVTKDFEVGFHCTDGLGQRRKAVCTRYVISPSP